MEPNDNIVLAAITGLIPGGTFRAQETIGNLTFQNFAQTDPALDVDFYRVELERGDILSVNLTSVVGSSLGVGVKIFDPQGIPLVSEFNSPRFDFIAPVSASFFVAVSSKDNISYNPLRILSGTPITAGSGGSYTIELTQHPGDLRSESNNTIGTAIPTGLSTEKPGAFVKSGFIDPGDADLFRLDLSQGDRLKIKTQTLRESSLDTFLRLFDLQGNVLATNDDANRNTRDSYLEFVAPSSGSYVIGLSDRSNTNYSPTSDRVGNSNFSGSYIISIAVDGAPPEQISDDIPSGAVSTGLSSATPGTKIFNGAIGNNLQVSSGLDRDLYSLEMSAGDRLILSTNTPALSELDSVLRVFDVAGREIAFNDDDPRRSTKDSYLEFVAPFSGEFFVGVSDFTNITYNPLLIGSGTSGKTGSYSLTMNLEGKAAQEPNDSLSQAQPIGFNTQLNEYIGNNPFFPAELDVDFYKIDLVAGVRITASVSSLALSSGLIPGLKIFDASAMILTEDRSAALPQLAGQFKTSTVEFTPRTSGTYFIGVSDVDNFDYNPSRPGSGSLDGLIGSYQIIVRAVA